MALVKTFLIGSVAVFGIIGMAAIIKQQRATNRESLLESVQEVPLLSQAPQLASAPISPSFKEEIQEVDRIPQLFALDSSKLPIVETISYTSRVPWLKDRAAWIADYANHYSTSRHFIARSLNRKPDYFTQKVSFGDRFNVFKPGLNIKFHLLIDLSSCRMWFYYIDLDTKERVLLKTYKVGLGRLDSKTASGYRTPVGKYQLGEKIAIYKPGTTSFFQDQKTEMIRVFGTRWIPFEKELEGCSESSKGLGLHGAPWMPDSAGVQLVEDRSKIGKYDSDGCIRLASDDIEELFSIIITKKTIVELVKDLSEAELPGVEKQL